MAPSTIPPPKAPTKSPFDDDLDDDGWQDMPVVRNDDFANGLDEEDQKKYHYVAPKTKSDADPTAFGNATGNLIDVDNRGNEWRAKLDQNESDYTRLRLEDDDDADEVHLRTRYLFDEDKAMTPLSQMQATKNLLTEAQRIAYVGLCALSTREMAKALKRVGSKELKPAVSGLEDWALKIMGRLYYHMELETAEQKMIESLAEHGVQAMDLAPALMTTHTVANPEYDPVEAKRVKALEAEKAREREEAGTPDKPSEKSDVIAAQQKAIDATRFQTTANVLTPSAPASLPGVTTSLSMTDENVTLDIRWTVLCDLFLLLIADSVYDARSRVLLELVATKLGLGWLDVVKFEKRVTEALEIQEGAGSLEQQEIIDGRMKAAKKKRYVMMGLATIGGGLVIGLSAGLLAPVIGAGLGAAFTTIGITGTSTFLAGTAGAAVITTGGVLTGSGIAVKGMARRTQQVRTFNILPLNNNKRVNCILTVSGFMTSPQDDVRLPFSVLDPIVGDVFSVLWEPEMMGETGNALKILTSEVLSQVGTTVLQATVMTALMSALQWPIILTKLGYLIDNPWNNALDRARAAGLVLADVLLQRSLGVRPITLIGFSLGARVIFYALLELAKQKAFGIVQDVFLLGTTVTAPTRTWLEVRGVIAGRFVNGFARNDWVLNYLFRATSGGLNTVAGLRPVENVPGLENVDVTDKIAGHTSYRTFMPLILDQLGFPVSADYFDEPVEPDMEKGKDRVVIREEDVKNEPKKGFGLFSRNKKASVKTEYVSRAPSATPSRTSTTSIKDDDDLPARTEKRSSLSMPSTPQPTEKEPRSRDSTDAIPMHAGFDFKAINEIIGKEGLNPDELKVPAPGPGMPPPPPVNITGPPLQRAGSTPIPESSSPPPTPKQAPRGSLNLDSHPSASGSDPVGGMIPRFTRSVSVNDVEPEPPTARFNGDPPTLSTTPSSRATTSSPYSSYQLPHLSTTSFNPQPPPPAPSLSFGGADGSVWSPDPDPPAFGANQFGGFGTKSPFAASTDTLSFGGADGSISFASAVSAPPDPFASSSISFGSADGSISFAPTSDPWTPKPLGRKSTFPSSNPWS